MQTRFLAAAALLLALAGCVEAPCAGSVTAQAVPGRAIAVTWEPVGNATSYLVLRGAGDAPLQPIAEVDAGELAYTDTNVTAGIVYTYAVATEPDAPLDGCSTARASLADASIPFFEGPATLLAAAGALLGALLILARRR